MTDPIVVSWSEISSRRSCPHKHWLEYRHRWTKPKPLNSALGKGTLFHACLEAYYLARKAGQPLDLCYEAGLGVLDAVEIESDFDQMAVDNVAWMYEGYHETYMGDTTWEIVGVEHKFRVQLPQIVPNQPEIWLKGSIDLIVRDEYNRLVVLDHKTCSTMPKEGTAFEMSDQFGLYLWALKQLGVRASLAVHNAVKSKMNKGDVPGFLADWEARKEAGEKVGARPSMQPLAGRYARRQMVRTAIELDTLAREAAATAVQAYVNPEFNHRTPNEDYCKYMCSFRDACLDGRRLGKEWELSRLEEEGFVQDFRRH